MEQRRSMALLGLLFWQFGASVRGWSAQRTFRVAPRSDAVRFPSRLSLRGTETGDQGQPDVPVDEFTRKPDKVYSPTAAFLDDKVGRVHRWYEFYYQKAAAPPPRFSIMLNHHHHQSTMKNWSDRNTVIFDMEVLRNDLQAQLANELNEESVQPSGASSHISGDEEARVTLEEKRTISTVMRANDAAQVHPVEPSMVTVAKEENASNVVAKNKEHEKGASANVDDVVMHWDSKTEISLMEPPKSNGNSKKMQHQHAGTGLIEKRAGSSSLSEDNNDAAHQQSTSVSSFASSAAPTATTLISDGSSNSLKTETKVKKMLDVPTFGLAAAVPTARKTKSAATGTTTKRFSTSRTSPMVADDSLLLRQRESEAEPCAQQETVVVSAATTAPNVPEIQQSSRDITSSTEKIGRINQGDELSVESTTVLWTAELDTQMDGGPTADGAFGSETSSATATKSPTGTTTKRTTPKKKGSSLLEDVLEVGGLSALALASLGAMTGMEMSAIVDVALMGGLVAATTMLTDAPTTTKATMDGSHGSNSDKIDMNDDQYDTSNNVHLDSVASSAAFATSTGPSLIGYNVTAIGGREN